MKNNRIILVLITIFGIILITSVIFFLFQKSNNILTPPREDADNKPREVAPQSELDKFIITQRDLMSPESARKRKLSQVEIPIPIETKSPIAKLTIVPVVASGGDALYEPIAQSPDGSFFVLRKSDFPKYFKVTSPEKSLAYLDFTMVKTGARGYDRFKKTVYKPEDYQNRECKDKNNNSTVSTVHPLPISEARATAEGFQVNWVYYSPTVPAGYWKKTYLVTQDGDIKPKDNPSKPFFPCGRGFMF